ncbi:Oxysterol-binding protein-domain-containing protein [Mucor lusitanicus]
MEVVQVQPRDFYLHYIYVPVKGTTIRWTFTTKKNNIAFGLYRRLGHTPLPSSSDIVLKAQQARSDQLLKAYPLSKKTEDDDSLLHDSSSHHTRARSKSIASEKLKEKNDWVELIPIEHVNSVKAKVEGSYTVCDSGNYILVFVVTFSVALVDPNMEQALEHPQAEISGWLLKKRRKKLQGWAKRWFELSKAGVLSYSATPTSLTRGSIQILLATISLNPQQRIIHIDSGSTLFHLRCQTNDEYKEWTRALKAYRDDEFLHKEYVADSQQEKRAQQQQQDFTSPPEIQLLPNSSSSSSFAADYHSADMIWSQIDAGIRTAELLSSNTAILKKNTESLFRRENSSESFTLTKESDLITSLAAEQARQWREIQVTMQHLLKGDPTLNSLSMTRSQSKTKLSAELADTQPADIDHTLLRTHSTNTSCSSIHNSFISDQFFDAESVVLTDDDEDYADHPGSVSTGDSSTVSTSDDEESEEEEEDLALGKPMRQSRLIDLISEPSNFHRRQILPSPAKNDGVSALSIFRKNIGKDLSQIAMPVSMNEPLSMLERACEDLEYAELLDKAAQCENSMDRIMYVAAFAVSSYSSSQWRSGRKPFNPMMSETYECIRPDKGFRFISEKVSHHPLIIASHAESQTYQYWQCTKIKSKFWGKSMEFMTEGTFHVSLNDKEHYTFTKPSSWMRNMIAGEKYLEHVGELKVINRTTGEYGSVLFKEGTGGGLFSAPKERNNVVGTFYTADGVKSKKMVGKWSDGLAEDVNMDGRTLSVLWKVKVPTNPDFSKKYYGFSQFAIELNEITPIEKGKLPKTDSRQRPDQRLYEEGHIDRADEEKLRIEKMQRETRAAFTEKGIPWNPRWFKLEQDPYEEVTFYPAHSDAAAEVGHSWQFAGEYWDVRESGEWPTDTPDLW